MAEYLVDTNHLSPLVTPGHPLRNRFLQSLQLGSQFAIATPALTEFLYGIQTVPRFLRNMREWNLLHNSFHYYDINRNLAERAGELQVQLRPRGWQLGTVDALIAAVALHYDLTLLSTDKDFSAIPGLRIENWFTSPLGNGSS